jgi:hypothetical protein
VARERTVRGRLLGLLGLRSTDDDAAINALRRTWPEFDFEWSRGGWRAYWIDGSREPLTGKTPGALAEAIYDAWAGGDAR